MASSETPKILVVDDDMRLRALLERYLVEQGYLVRAVANYEQMQRMMERENFHLVVLDLMLPDIDGLEVCRRIRALPQPTNRLPVLMLTAKGDPMDRIIGLEMGADDYLPKPFEPRELQARIKAILRRGGGSATTNQNSQLQFGSLSIDKDSRTVSVAGQVAELTSHQFDLLWVLAERAGRVLSRDQIMELVRGKELEAFDRSIDVHMGRIRSAIEKDPKNPQRILTVRGVGYVLARQQD